MPAVGGESALRHHLEALARGAPDQDRMSPQTADLVRQQLQYLGSTLTAFGELESIVFKGVGLGGFAIYTLKFAHGAAQVRLSVRADGKVEGLNFRPEGDGTPGAFVACSEEATLKASTGTIPSS